MGPSNFSGLEALPATAVSSRLGLHRSLTAAATWRGFPLSSGPAAPPINPPKISTSLKYDVFGERQPPPPPLPAVPAAPPGFVLLRLQDLQLLAPRWAARCELLAEAGSPTGAAATSDLLVSEELGIRHLDASSSAVPPTTVLPPAVAPCGAPVPRRPRPATPSAHPHHRTSMRPQPGLAVRAGRVRAMARLLDEADENSIGWGRDALGARVGWGTRRTVRALPGGGSYEVEERCGYLVLSGLSMVVLVATFFLVMLGWVQRASHSYDSEDED